MNLPLFSRLFQLPVSLRVDLLLTAGEHVLRRDVANGTVQACWFNVKWRAKFPVREYIAILRASFERYAQCGGGASLAVEPATGFKKKSG